jgi:hypothetical protein
MVYRILEKHQWCMRFHCSVVYNLIEALYEISMKRCMRFQDRIEWCIESLIQRFNEILLSMNVPPRIYINGN